MAKLVLILFASAMGMWAQSDTLHLDPRLSIHTLLREDIFAGVLTNDQQRLARAEKNIETLLAQRPKASPDLLAWKGDIALYRAVIAHESAREEEFHMQYERALELFSEAKRTGPDSIGVAAVIGGSLLALGRRLPDRYREAALSEAYDEYHVILRQQSAFVDKMPLHMKGELLSGLAESAWRMNRSEEAGQYVDRIIATLPNTPYSARATKWKQNPVLASSTSLNCQTCHEEGRLAVRAAALAK